jgi:hypothetical protein
MCASVSMPASEFDSRIELARGEGQKAFSSLWSCLELKGQCVCGMQIKGHQTKLVLGGRVFACDEILKGFY